MTDRMLVVSAGDLLARTFQVLPTDRKSKAGTPVNALFGVARAIHRAFAFKLPARAVAVLDAAAPLPGWPAILAEQVPELRELVETAGITLAVAADEVHVVASYAAAALAAGDDVVIVGCNKRYAQLVSDRVWWYDPNKDARYTPDMVMKRFTVGPAQVSEWLGVVGEADAALPGVPGIGAKGATGLLETFGTMEAALAAVDTIKGRPGNALRAAGNEAVLAELARARLDTARPLPVPLDRLAFAPPTTSVRNALYDRLGFVELLADDGTTVAVEVCESDAALEAALARFGGALVAFHALSEDDGSLAGVAIAGAEGAIYAAMRPRLAAWLGDASAPKVAHIVEGTAVALHHAGVQLAGVVGDSAAASHLTQPSNWAPHDLPIVAKHVLGRALPDEDKARGVGRLRKPWSALPPERAADHAAAYASAAYAIWNALAPAVDPALLAEYRALSETLVRMELCGLVVDRDELARAEVDFVAIEEELQTQIESLAGHAFNINSSKQLGTVLFEELKLPIVSHTKTGWSTANEALERIEHAHPIVPLVIRWRTLRRLRESWITSLPKYIAADGRIHGRFHPARSFSGTLVNTAPDLSRVPGRTPEMARIRRAFLAPAGCVLMSIDYNQLGLHVLAHLTKDPALVEPLRQRDDMHVLTAEAVLEKPRDTLTDADRQIGKVVNFATFAGQGASALALQLDISPAEAKELIARFDRRYAMVRAFQDEQLRLARERGYIQTIAGRKWPIGLLESLDNHDRSYAERMARRATHEGSVADISRRGLLDADRALRAAGLRAQPVLQILDEVLFEVPLAEVDAAARIGAEAMRDAFALEVPLCVGVEVGPNWADLERIAID